MNHSGDFVNNESIMWYSSSILTGIWYELVYILTGITYGLVYILIGLVDLEDIVGSRVRLIFIYLWKVYNSGLSKNLLNNMSQEHTYMSYCLVQHGSS